MIQSFWGILEDSQESEKEIGVSIEDAINRVRKTCGFRKASEKETGVKTQEMVRLGLRLKTQYVQREKSK